MFVHLYAHLLVFNTDLATRSGISRRSNYGGYTALWQAAWCHNTACYSLLLAYRLNPWGHALVAIELDAHVAQIK